MIRPTLATCVAMGFYSRPKYDTTLLSKYPEHEQTARRVAEEGVIYLKTGMKFYRLILRKIEKYY